MRLVLGALLVCALSACAAEEPLPEPDPTRDLREFRPPPPLRPTAINTAPEKGRAPWKTEPVSVLSQDLGARRDLVEVELDTRRQEEDVVASRKRQLARAKVRRVARERAATRASERAQVDLDALVADGAKAREAKAKAFTAGEADAVARWVADAVERAGPTEIGVLAQLVDQRERADADAAQAGRRASEARRNADLARRFLVSSLKTGIRVRAARGDAVRAEGRARPLELRALESKQRARCALLAEARVRTRGLPR